MTFYKNRHKFENFSVKTGVIFSKFGLSPNQWTLVTLIPTFISLYYLINEQYLMTALFFIVASFIDVIDGSVARVMGKATKLGAYLDTVIDRYVEGIIIFGLLFASLPNFIVPYFGWTTPIAGWIFIFFFGSLMTTYVKAGAKEKDLTEGKEIKGGLLERAERLLILFVGIILAAVNPLYLTYVIVILAILSNISAIQRIRIAIKLTKKHRTF